MFNFREEGTDVIETRKLSKPTNLHSIVYVYIKVCARSLETIECKFVDFDNFLVFIISVSSCEI